MCTPWPNVFRIHVMLIIADVKIFNSKIVCHILSNKRNAPNRKLNHKFSSTVKVFMNIDVRYKFDITFESTIKLQVY